MIWWEKALADTETVTQFADIMCKGGQAIFYRKPVHVKASIKMTGLYLTGFIGRGQYFGGNWKQ